MSRTEQTARTAAELVAALLPAIARMDLPRAVERHGSIEGVADKMISAVPDRYISDPPVGAVYSTAALARWKQITRQAVFAQYRAGRLFAAIHDGKLVFPSCQFDAVGNQLPRFRELLGAAPNQAMDLAGFATWIHTADERTGRNPAEQLRASVPVEATQGALPRRSELTVIQPPTRTTTSSTRSSR
jgi:hypothetical protein